MQLSYKRKFSILLITSCISLIVIYLGAIRKTINVRKETKALNLKNEAIKELPNKNLNLTKKLSEIDQLLAQNNQSNSSMELILETVSVFCQENQLILREFPASQSYISSGYNVETNVFVVQGSFEKALRLIYALEQKYKIGKVSSVNFQVEKDPRTEINSLLTHIYLQNIKTNRS